MRLSGITGRLACQVVRLLVNDNRMTDHSHLPFDMQTFDDYIQVRVAFFIRFQIPEVAGMMLGTVRAAMLMTLGIPVSAGAGKIGGGEVGLFVDVKAVLAWRKAIYGRDDANAIRLLRKRDSSHDLALIIAGFPEPSRQQPRRRYDRHHARRSKSPWQPQLRRSSRWTENS